MSLISDFSRLNNFHLRGLMHKSIYSSWLVVNWLHFEEFWEVSVLVVKNLLRMPNEAFFHWNPKRLGLGRQIGQINFGSFGVFSVKLSAPIFVLWVACPCFPFFQPLFLQKTKPLISTSQIFIWDWDLNLGLKQSGTIG